MVFSPGPVFTNILLADEINRTPPKTQSALLEAMQEHRVTIQGRTYTLDEPFHVFATQNPIELEGTYPLPEAQLDRFMFQIHIGYLSADEELAVVKETTSIKLPELARVVSGGDIVKLQQVVRQVTVPDAVANYAIALARATRPTPTSPDFIKDWVSYGVSVRAAQFLVLGGKARALLHGRLHANFDDIVALAHPVLRHRILLNFRAQSERVTTDAIIEKLLGAVPRPTSGL
jgi:MoxR-like ATPase